MARKRLSKRSYFARFKDRAVSSGVLISLRIGQCLKWPYCCLRVFWNRALSVLLNSSLERLSTARLRQIVPRDQVSPLLVVYCSLFVVSRNFLIHKNCFELFLNAHFLFCEIFNLNLTFAVYVKALTLYYHSQKTNRIGATRPFPLAVSCSRCTWTNEQFHRINFSDDNAAITGSTCTWFSLTLHAMPCIDLSWTSHLYHCLSRVFTASKLFISSKERSVLREMLATDIYMISLIERLRTIDCVGVFKGSSWRP